MLIHTIVVTRLINFFWANDSFDKKRGRHNNERTELRLRIWANIWVLALA